MKDGPDDDQVGTPDSDWGNPELPDGADDGPTIRDNPAVPHPKAVQHVPVVDRDPDADDVSHITS